MNKIIHRFQLMAICAIVFSLPVCAQDSLLNKYGLRVINSPEELQRIVKGNPGKAMTDLQKKIPWLLLDLRYATDNNFMRMRLYPKINTTYLRKTAADSLIIVQKDLNGRGLGLKIFDAYRPYSVTERMWEPIKDDRYVADPKKGSNHNRGVAVDLTIIDLKTGKELNMGTGFDNFSDTAHHTFTGLPEEILQNRLLLKKVMESHGFKAFDTEWWHYSLPNATDFELLDIGFVEMKKLNLQ